LETLGHLPKNRKTDKLRVMNKMISKIEKKFNEFLEAPVNSLVWAGSFFAIVGLRMLIERIGIPATDAPMRVLTDYLHNIFFFLISYLVIWLIISQILRIKPQKVAFFLLCAAWLIVLPPILDILKTGGGVFWSFYALGNLSEVWANFWTFFGRLPSGIVYFGTKIIFATSVFLIFCLILAKTKKVGKSVTGALLAYLTLFIMGTFPSWLAYCYYFLKDAQPFGDVPGFKIAQLVGSPGHILGLYFGDFMYTFPYNLDLIYFPILVFLAAILFWKIDKAKFLAVLKNARYPQLVYHSGLLVVGLGLGYLAYPENLNLSIFTFFAIVDILSAVFLAWLASVIVNDIYDFGIDEVSNPERPLQKKVFSLKEYWELGILLFVLSLLGALVVGVKFALIMFFYQLLAWAYSAPPFRLKKFLGIATFVSALCSLLVVFSGFVLFSGEQNIVGLSGKIIILIIAALTLSLPIKDLKDIAGDKKYGIWTVPVVFGEEKGRLITAVGIFISFMLSVFLLSEFRLFWWAMLFGGITFLIVINSKIKPRRIFWWVMAPVAAYGLIMVKILFL
jgi:chlorophyll/bacteriochlorophyll a synthase